MTVDNLLKKLPDKVKQENLECLIEKTHYSHIMILNPEITAKFFTPDFLLYNTLEYAFITIDCNETKLLMHVKCNPDNDGVEHYNPYFFQGKIFDLTNELNYDIVPYEINTSYAICIISDNCNNFGVRKLQFKFDIYHTRYSFEKIFPTGIEMFERLEGIFWDKKVKDIQINDEDDTFLYNVVNQSFPVILDTTEENVQFKNAEQVEYNNMESKVFDTLLRYLYLGKTTEIDFGKSKNYFLFHLIRAADRYNICDLKKHLIYKTIKRLNIQNVIDIFIFANQQQIKDLKEVCMKFIRTYGKEVSNVQSFQELITDHLKLSAQLLIYIYQN